MKYLLGVLFIIISFSGGYYVAHRWDEYRFKLERTYDLASTGAQFTAEDGYNLCLHIREIEIKLNTPDAQLVQCSRFIVE